MPFHSVAILGPGLIGGSLVLALQAREDIEVAIWARRQGALDELCEGGVTARSSTDLCEIVEGADLVILATPLPVMGELAQQVRERLGEGTLVTDVGSVKAPVVGELDHVLEGTGAVFLGSHPMAGSEQSGFSAARADLYEGAPCVLTPTGSTRAEHLADLRAFWQSLGCHVVEMTAEEHDRRIALISHLPHVAASLLVDTALGIDPESALVAGSGFRDTTRVASGDPELWTGILAENRIASIAALEGFQERLAEVLGCLYREDDEELREFLARARDLREDT